MKRNLYLIVTTMIMAAALSSCQKDLGKPAQADISQEDLAMAQKITSFIARMNSPVALKSDGIISVDDALWNVEAAMNYTFADIPEQFGDTKVDTLAFTLSVENGFCRENDLSALYQSMDVAVQEYCNSLDEYQVLGVDINMSEEVSGSITVSVIRGSSIMDSFLTFGPNEYWPSGIAASKIQSKANFSIPKVAVPNGTVYYTDFSQILTTWGHEYDNLNPNYQPGIDDPLMEYMFYCAYPEDDIYGKRILSPNVLNFYLTNLKNFGNNNIPSGKDLVSYAFWYEIYVSIPIRPEYHIGYAKYGIRHVKPAYPGTE